MDALDQILSSLRLTGGVVIDGEFSGDFCVLAQFTPNHFAPFFPMPETLISYHYVRSGHLLIEVDGQPPTRVEAGGIAILPRNDAHTLASRSGLRPADASHVRWVTDEGVHHVSSGTDGPRAEVWCGFLGTAKSSAHPLLNALPPLLTLDVTSGEAQWLDSSMRFLAEQSPSPDVVARLAELFLAQAIREYVKHLPADSKVWLRGLTDPAVSKVLSVIHSRYAEDLDVEGLAREAGVSRSVLRERFGEMLGEPPMRYCARWRMRVAANMLRDGKQNSANIAYSVGFNSEAAFNRAFKREYGEPPATWRRQVEKSSEAGEERAADRRPNQLFVSGVPTGVHWLTRHIGEFVEANPGLSIELDPNSNVVSFDGDGVDCALRCGPKPPADLAVEDLFSVDFTPMCSPDFLARHPNLKSAADLLGVARLTPSDAWWHELWRHFGLAAPAAAVGGAEMGAQMLDGVAALRGQGVALLTPMFWHDELKEGRLVCPLQDRIDGNAAYWLVYPKDRADWPKIRRFSAWLRDLCRNAQAESDQAAVAP